MIFTFNASPISPTTPSHLESGITLIAIIRSPTFTRKHKLLYPVIMG